MEKILYTTTAVNEDGLTGVAYTKEMEIKTLAHRFHRQEVQKLGRTQNNYLP